MPHTRTSSSSRHSSRPGSSRLATITERGGPITVPAVPRKSSKRLSFTPSNPTGSPRPWSRGETTAGSVSTAPPAYDWVPDPAVGADDNNAPVEGEKLAGLRRDEAFRTPRRRGGWGRVALIVGAILLVVIALAVGLGVGLSQRNNNKNGNSDESSGSSSTSSNLPPQKFPLGEYSIPTLLTNVDTSCASDSATWRCYPFTTYDSSVPSTENSSVATFNWIINNTESSYATASSSASGSMPANLTVSANGDIFGITFGQKALTYVASSSNSSSAHYAFSFTMDRQVVPSPSIAADGRSSVCFFNQTVFAGKIYLSASRDFPSGAQANSTSIGGYEQWPYAVEVTQTAAGGDNVPNCYETKDGVVGARITTGISAEAPNSECLCEYRNYY